jgi:hypothetical protein
MGERDQRIVVDDVFPHFGGKRLRLARAAGERQQDAGAAPAQTQCRLHDVGQKQPNVPAVIDA